MMKKILLSSAAVCGLMLVAGQAQAADGLKLDLGGWFKGYGAYVDQDETTDTDARTVDILRNTELHFTGETTLDNGLTVGFHTEAETDNSNSFEVEESYAYFTGAWGRVNFGAENGAAYLLQVEAPSADGNVDGIRQFIDGVNYSIAPAVLGSDAAVGGVETSLFNGIGALAQVSNGANDANGGGDDFLAVNALDFNAEGSGAAFDLFSFDYDDDTTGYANKLTYLTPIFVGFQAGVSYTPENNDDTASDDRSGVGIDDQAGTYGDSYELGLRYEGQFDQVGVIAGAGFTHSELEEDQDILFEDNNNNNVFNDGVDEVVSERDDRQSYNAGVDLDFGPFGLGVAYVHDDLGVDGLDADRETYVVGADYTTGPFKLGASYYNQSQELDAFLGEGAGELESDRYTGGVTYTYGPGMSFRGSVSHIQHDVDNSVDVDATSVLLGTQINF